MNFDLKKAKIYRAVVFYRFLNPHVLRIFAVILLVAGSFALFAFLAGGGVSFTISEQTYTFGPYADVNTSFFWGIFLISLPSAFTLLFLDLFYKSYLRKPKVKEDEKNIAEHLDFAAAQIFSRAYAISARAGEGALSTNSVVASALSHPGGKRLMYRLGIDPKEFAKSFLPSENDTTGEDASRLLQEVDKLRREHKDQVNVGDIFIALYDTNDRFQKMLAGHDMQKKGLKAIALWHERAYQEEQHRRKFWELDNLLRMRSIGAEWVYGFSTLLSSYSVDVTRFFREGRGEVDAVGREETIQRLEEGLMRGDKKNVLLVGEPGVGKRTVVYGLAQRIAFNKAPKELKSKKLLRLDLSAITSTSPEQAAENLRSILEEAEEAGNVILFIKRIHNFVGQQSGAGKLDIAEVLLPHLQSSNIQVVATTDPVSYHKFLAPRVDVAGAFGRIDMAEPERADMLTILQNAALKYEASSKLFFTYQAIEAIYEDARRFLQAPAFPEKALTLMDDVTSYAKNQKKPFIQVQDVHNIITTKTDVPLGDVGEEEKQKLSNLGTIMHKEIIGQEAAVKTVVTAMQRLRAGITKEGKPAGVFLFAGPTGVGKTLTAQVLARVYFGSQDKMLRFDMSEYQTPDSIERILGSLQTETPGQLATAVRDNPFSVILLDEFEKAHKDILNVFLRIFDEGKMTDVFGREVNFENNIIIATSNAGAEEIRKIVKTEEDLLQKRDYFVELFIERGYFKPELLNRFDEIVFYHALNREQVKQIAELLIKKLVKRLKAKGYYFKPTPEILDYITEVGFDPQFGARPMNRAIADKLESYIAKQILENNVKKGQEFTISPEELSRK